LGPTSGRNRIATSLVVHKETKEHLQMKRTYLAAILSVATLTMTLGAGCGSDKKKPGCTKDTDCKGERVCTKGSCVSPTAESEDPAKAGTKKAPTGLAAALNAMRPKGTTPGGPATGPGTPGPGTGPGTGTGPGPSGNWKKGSIRICLGPRCVGLGRGFGTNTQDMRAMLDMLKQLVFSGLGGMGSAQLPKVKVCVGPQCVTVDKNLLSNPMTLLKLFSNLNPQMLRNLFDKIVKRRPSHSPGLRPHRTTPSPPPRATPPATGIKPISSYADLLSAGAKAVGRTANLAQLTITSVSDTRLVLEGPGREMIVLRIPGSLKSLLPKLRITTTKVTVRFRVLSRPIGKLVHGELLSYD